MEKLENRYHYILLFSIYRNLLSKKQISYLEDYLENDISFSEIASLNNVSRQAVFDNVQKAFKQLEEIEKSLKLSEKYKKILLLLEKNKDYKVSKISKDIEEILMEMREDV